MGNKSGLVTYGKDRTKFQSGRSVIAFLPQPQSLAGRPVPFEVSMSRLLYRWRNAPFVRELCDIAGFERYRRGLMSSIS
jgi:hypothetical protein